MAVVVEKKGERTPHVQRILVLLPTGRFPLAEQLTQVFGLGRLSDGVEGVIAPIGANLCEMLLLLFAGMVGEACVAGALL